MYWEKKVGLGVVVWTRECVSEWETKRGRNRGQRSLIEQTPRLYKLTLYTYPLWSIPTLTNYVPPILSPPRGRGFAILDASWLSKPPVFFPFLDRLQRQFLADLYCILVVWGAWASSVFVDGAKWLRQSSPQKWSSRHSSHFSPCLPE